ncbi:hypothetical protein [Nocardia farcinica]|uniref:hypothetical protein n=1 Tax=Nocardia farcinica TaxID=37329 RepID=UPI002456C010|nr:hypothetical protein [Nocardia farcinica]
MTEQTEPTERLDRVTDEQLRCCTSTPQDLDFWPEDRAMRLMAAELIEWRGLRARITARLEKHRTSSTVNIHTGEYKNPARRGYDMALTEVLAIIDAIAEENPHV